MTVSLASSIGKGLTPQQFMDGMTRNQEQFASWYNQFAWENEDIRSFFSSLRYRDDLRCLIIAADWCGDVVRNVPVVFRAMEEAEIPTEVLIMEEHLEVMDQFLTMGGRAIPIVLLVDTGGFVLGQWGPRPEHVQTVMRQFKQENPDRNVPDYEEKIKGARMAMMERYGEGTGYQAVIVQELRDLISGL